MSLEPGLVAAMLGDVAEEPGVLPLMEYALTELFDLRDGRLLTLDSYREIGGVSGALGRRAEALYDDLADEAKEAARQLFLRMVALGEGTEDTRRRATRTEIASLGLDEKPMTSAIDAFGAARLLSFDRDAATGAPTIELAHEALLTAWPRLHHWIDAAREDLRTERRLATATKDWTDADRDPSFLLAGSRLEQADTWAAESGIAVTPEERAYIDASRTERDRREVAEREREEHELELERRSVSRLRVIVGVLALAAILAVGLTVYAIGQQREAETQGRTAQARELAAASVANLDIDPERSILLALESIDLTRSADGTVLPEAEEALHRAVTTSRIVLTEPELGGSLDWSPQGVFVTEGPEDISSIDIRDAATGDRVTSWTGHEVDINDVRFSQDGSVLATAGDDGAVKVWSATGDEISAFAGSGVTVGLSFDEDGSLVSAAWPDDGAVRTHRSGHRAARHRVHRARELPRDTALSPDGDRVAVAMGAIGAVVVYDVSTGDELFELLGHVYPPSSVAWSPDGRWIASGAYDGAVRIFDADTGALDSELPGHAGLVISVDWSPDGRRLVSGGSDGTARVWSIEGAVRREILRLSAQQTRSGTFAAFSPDGDQVMTGDAGIQAVKIWDVSRLGGEEVVNLETDQLAPVDVAYAPDGHIVAPIRTGLDRSVDRPRRPRVDDRTRLGPPTAVVNIAVNGDGTRVATGRNFSPFTTVWDTGTGETLFEFSDTKRRFNEVADLAWGPDGTHLAVSDLAGYVDVLDGRGASVAFLDAGEGTAIEGVAFGPDGRFDRGHRDRIRIPARVPRPAVGLGARGARRHLEDGGPGHADVRAGRLDPGRRHLRRCRRGVGHRDAGAPAHVPEPARAPSATSPTARMARASQRPARTGPRGCSTRRPAASSWSCADTPTSSPASRSALTAAGWRPQHRRTGACVDARPR